MSIKNREFWESATMNNVNYLYYYRRLVELAISMFKWDGFPKTVDTRFLELGLFTDGFMLYFSDVGLGELALRAKISGTWNVYNIPTERQAYASNGYNANRTEKDSVIIFNNMLHSNSLQEIQMFAKRLWEYDRVCDINIKAQKTPILVQCKKEQRLTMKNLYMKYEGNEPFIFGDNSLGDTPLRVLTTSAPYIADKVYKHKMNIWYEALEYLGIPSVANEKAERMNTDEVNTSQGACIASRFSRLSARQQGCEKIGEMFGRVVTCEYRAEVEALAKAYTKQIDESTQEGLQ